MANDDLISRQALMKEFSDFVRRSNNSDFAPTPTWNDAVSLVESIPSAERRGRWMDHSDEWDGGYYECSVCGEAFSFIEGTPKENNYRYCPSCGAQMEAE